MSGFRDESPGKQMSLIFTDDSAQPEGREKVNRNQTTLNGGDSQHDGNCCALRQLTTATITNATSNVLNGWLPAKRWRVAMMAWLMF